MQQLNVMREIDWRQVPGELSESGSATIDIICDGEVIDSCRISEFFWINELEEAECFRIARELHCSGASTSGVFEIRETP